VSVPVQLADGTEGTLLAFDGKEGFELALPRAFAPGAPFEVRIGLEGAGAVAVKCRGSKRQADGGFRVRARCVDLRRVVRERLLEALAEG
jgi:hypothetical protein